MLLRTFWIEGLSLLSPSMIAAVPVLTLSLCEVSSKNNTVQFMEDLPLAEDKSGCFYLFVLHIDPK